MALKALDIFKLTPKKNCKDCGFPTCMAFCMKVASGAVEVEKCPHMSQESLNKLSEATGEEIQINLASLEKAEVLHDEVWDKSQMREALVSFLDK